jgi:hypothetical protein
MVKNEWLVEIPTYVGLTNFISHFTTFSNAVGRVELFVPFFYDALDRTNSLELTTCSYSCCVNNVPIAKEEKISWNKSGEISAAIAKPSETREGTILLSQNGSTTSGGEAPSVKTGCGWS